MNPQGAPLVTVAVPLFRSHKFVSVISGNLSSLSYPNLEILISDRHLYDDAIDVLEEKFGRDPRVRYLRERDKIAWPEHFNSLLKMARGKYFFWMPHDDSFSPNYVSDLVLALEREPDAILAFGSTYAIDRDGTRVEVSGLADPVIRPSEPWSGKTALRLLVSWHPGIAQHGIFRRAPLMERNLFIRPTRGGVLADEYWVFATGLIGKWLYEPDCICSKRFHGKSAHARWRFAAANHLDSVRVLLGYLFDYAPDWKTRARGVAAIAGYQFAWNIERLKNAGRCPGLVAKLVDASTDALLISLVGARRAHAGSEAQSAGDLDNIAEKPKVRAGSR